MFMDIDIDDDEVMDAAERLGMIYEDDVKDVAEEMGMVDGDNLLHGVVDLDGLREMKESNPGLFEYEILPRLKEIIEQ